MAALKRTFYSLLLLCSFFVIGQLWMTKLEKMRVGKLLKILHFESKERHVRNGTIANDTEQEGENFEETKRKTKDKNFLATTFQTKGRHIPPFRGFLNSEFRSPYHRYWDTNCSAIFLREQSVIDATNQLLNTGRVNGDIPVPSDKNFTRYTQNCTAFRKFRKYPERPNSKIEKDYPLAYIIVTHKEVAQVERLLRAIYQPQNIYCIHPDRKSPEDYQEAIRGLASCFDNVFIPSKVEKVHYAGFTRLQADINCMADLLKTPVQWKYVMNLCGQDFPLKTNLEIVRQLKAYKGHNDINGIIPPSYIVRRTQWHHATNEDGGGLHRTKERKAPPPHNFTVHFGNAYFAATHAYVNFVINDQRAIDLLKWSEDTWSPDETYWVTLQRYPRVPGGYHNATWDSIVRLIKWGDVAIHPDCIGKYVRGICVFGVGYLQYLLSQPYLFANKFHYSFDPVTLQCIEEMLEYRQRYPETIHQYVPEFPVTSLVWQNHTAYLGD